MEFSTRLIQWYQLNKRDLPWRSTHDPYNIWLSEIILQQTRVKQGLPYYLSFVKSFPSINNLALAQEEDVLKLWQGLGYYSRARNMHFTAKQIIEQYNGEFPADYKKLLELKGVGPYTAAAISSIAFNLPYAVVDGNVFRVLGRVFGIDIPFDTTIGKKRFNELAQKLLIEDKAAIYNQAIMEFGALQCKPKSPNCSIYTMRDFCVAYNSNKVNKLPLRVKKVKVRSRYIHFLIIHTNKGICISKRDSGIWQGLYEFPFLEFSTTLSNKKVVESDSWKKFFVDNKVYVDRISKNYIHHLSHQKIHAKFWTIIGKKFSHKSYDLVASDMILKLPVSRLIDKYLNMQKIK